MRAGNRISCQLALLVPVAFFVPSGHAAERGPVIFAAPLEKAWCDGQSFVRLRDQTLTFEMKNGAVDFNPVHLIEASGTRFVYSMPNSRDFRWTIRHRGTHIEMDGLGVVLADAVQHNYSLHTNFYPC